jgi:hypothetical protein
MDEHFYFGIANELAAKLRRVSSFISHGPSVGAYHEEALRSVLRTLLPDRFSLRTGFAYDPEQGVSNQGDLLVVDEHHPAAYFLREGDFAIVSAEALVCVIEVKTKLTKKTFLDAIDTLYSFRKIGGIPNHPITFLFAYEGAPLKLATLDAWYKATHVPDALPNYPWAMCVLNQGAIILRGPSAGAQGHVICSGPETRGTRILALCLFLQILRKVLLMHGQSNIDPFAQVKVGNFSWTKQSLRFGTGVTAEKGA